MEIGTDIVKIDYFFNKSEDFFRKILGENELKAYSALCSEKRKAEYAASRWAGKEAIFKATQDPAYLSYEILNDPSGKPYVLNHPEIKITLSHHVDYAIAFAVTE